MCGGLELGELLDQLIDAMPFFDGVVELKEDRRRASDAEALREFVSDETLGVLESGDAVFGFLGATKDADKDKGLADVFAHAHT